MNKNSLYELIKNHSEGDDKHIGLHLNEIDILKKLTHELLATRALSVALLENHPDPEKVKKSYLGLLKESEAILAEIDIETNENTFEPWHKIILLIDAAIIKK